MSEPLKMWAIKDVDGNLFWACSNSRRLAIARHVFNLDQTCFDAGYPLYDKKLNCHQKAAWRQKYKKGHRCVRVVVTEEKST